MTAEPAKSLEILARRAGVSSSEYSAYADGTRLFTLAENLEALGAPPQACDQIADPTTRLKYIDCAAHDITSFLLNDAMLIVNDIPAEKLAAAHSDRFVSDYARRNP